MKIGIGVLGVLVAMTSTVVAHAQEDDAMGDGGDESVVDALSDEDAAPAEEAVSGDGDAAPAAESRGGGGRFRFGIAGGAGPLSADNLDMTYYGMDLRLGWQINDELGVYVQPQLGYYKLDGADALFGSGGLLGASIVADYTLFDMLFVGAGVGEAVLNNPSGMELHFRAGGYPLMGRNEKSGRRKGLMLGIDFRLHFVEDYTFVAPTFNIGYESF